MKIEEDAGVIGPANQTSGVEGPKSPIKAKGQNLFRRVSDIKKKRDKRKERSISDFL